MNIEFVEPRMPPRWAWNVAGLAFALALASAGVLAWLQADLRALQARLLASQRHAAAMASAPPVARAAPPYQASAEAALHRAALPEAAALMELERVAEVGIQLRSIDVDGAEGLVIVELDAASDAALGDYLDQLNAGQPVPVWHIQRLSALVGEPRPGAALATAAGQGEGHAAFIARSLVR
jgi:hypothetical protein